MESTAHAMAAPAGFAAAPPIVHPAQEPLRFGIGLAALVFYLWIIHSYKLPAGDVAVLGLGVGVLMRSGSIRVPPPLVFFGALILWAMVGLGVTEDAVVTRASLLSLAKLWVIAFCILNVIRSAAELRFLIIAWLGVYALYPVRGALYNQYICHCTEFGRVAWNFVFENPNDLAAISMIPLGLAAGIGYVERVKIWRYAGLIGVAILSLTIMLTQSRGAMLGIGLGAIMLPLSSRRKGRDMLLLVALMGAAALAAPRGVWERLAGLSNVSVQGGMKGVDPEGSAESRWQIWQIAISTIKKNPLTGVGAGMMPIAHRWEALRRNEVFIVRGVRDTHSTYLRLTAETGFPGLILYLLMWGSVMLKLRTVRKKIRNERPRDQQMLLFIEMSIVAFMVASTFGTYPYLSFTYLSIAVAWLTASILEKEPWYVPRSAMAAPVAVPVFRR